MYGAPASPGLRALNAVMNGDARVAQMNAVGAFNFSTTTSINGTSVNHNTADGFALAFQAPGGPFNIDSTQFADHPILKANGFSVITAAVPALGIGGTSNLVTRCVFVEMLDFEQLLEQNCVLQFWARTSLQIGTHHVVFDVGQVGLDNQKFIAQFSFRQLNTWEQFFIPIKFEDSILSLPAGGSRVRILAIHWPLLVGANRQSANPALIGAWTVGGSPNYSTINPPQYGGTGANFRVTDVSLTVANGRVPFFRPDVNETLQRAKRYFWHTFPYGVSPGQNILNGAGGTTVDGRIKYSALVAATVRHTFPITYPVEMMRTPTVTYFNPEAVNANWRNETAGANSGAPAADQLSAKTATLANPQAALDAVGNVMTIHAQFDARMS